MTGKVFLVGSGPGGEGLLTKRARAVIDSADVVLYDQLPGEEILSTLPGGAERIDCGKYGGRHVLEQAEIESLIVDRAKAGKRVVPASVGIPLTHRKYASQVTILTGNEDPTKPEPALDWELLARSRGTIVVLMGVANLEKIAHALMENGKPETTPVAVIERGLRSDRRVTTGTLATIGPAARAAGVKPPAVIVIGDVVRLYDPDCPDLIPSEG